MKNIFENKDWPKISIITPSYNQSSYIEETICSILSQNYPNLEYIIIDGGSTDGSVDIIKKYESHLSYWVSEADKGQYNAISKGFSHASGDILAWLNADDIYFNWTLKTVASIFSKIENVDWITSCHQIIIDESSSPLNCVYIPYFPKSSFLKGEFLPGLGWYSRGFIQQESTFWRRSIYDKSGAYVDDELDMAGDFDLWCRFFKHSDLYGLRIPLAGFRMHSTQKTAIKYEKYMNEAYESLNRHGGNPRGKIESWIIRNMPNVYQILNNIINKKQEKQSEYLVYIKEIGWTKKTSNIKY